MSFCEENRFQPKLICNKGDILLSEIKNSNYNTRSYNLAFTIPNIDNSVTNINNLTSLEIYNLLEKQNNDLIEKVVIINETNNEADICILINHLAKEIGIKQKYLLFRTTKIINKFNNSVTFYNKDLKLVCEKLKEDYLKQLNFINSDCEAVIYNYGKTQINVQKEDDELISVKFNIDLQVIINDNLPLYMENLIGLMLKKMFYNLKNSYNVNG
jgi:hypothetical protein